MKIHLNIILPSTYGYPQWSLFPQVSQPEPCAHLSLPPYAPHTPPISFFSILPPANYWVRSTDPFCLQRKHLDLWIFHNMGFHGEALLAPRPTPKMEDHPSSAVRDCLFNLFAATLHIGGRSSIRKLRTLHAVVTGTHLTWVFESKLQIFTVVTTHTFCSHSPFPNSPNAVCWKVLQCTVRCSTQLNVQKSPSKKGQTYSEMCSWVRNSEMEDHVFRSVEKCQAKCNSWM